MSSRAPVILTKFRNLGEQMKKIVKMSLVAAVAVAGLTTANAKPLEEAIKDVDVSGTVVYRYNDYNNDAKGAKDSTTTNNYKIGLNVSSKVNDDVKVNTRFIVGDAGDLGFATLNTGTEADGSVGVELSNVYFSYTGIMNTTVNVGKQGLTTPWTVAIDSDGPEQTGTGILALSTWGPVTVAGAYFNQTNLGESGVLNNPYSTTNAGPSGSSAADIAADNAAYGNNIGENDIWTAAVIANVGPVALDAWYLDMEDVFDTFTIGAKANFDLDAVKLGAEARYTSLDLDGKSDDNDMLKVILTAKAGIVDAKLGYATTDKDGGLVALNDFAVTAYQTWNMNPNNKADADFWNASVGVQALDSLHISANYATLEYAADEDGKQNDEQEELYTQITYNMSKNLSTYVRFGTYTAGKDGNDDSANDDLRGRLQVQYSF